MIERMMNSGLCSRVLLAIVLASCIAIVCYAAQPATKPARRFIDRGDMVEDTQTGLLWQKDGDASGKLNYYQAAEYAKSLRLGKQQGWRVPTREELAAIFPAVVRPFKDTKYNERPFNRKERGEWNSYWTSELDTQKEDYAFVYQWYADGGPNNCYASKNFVYVRCVHDPIKKPNPTTRGS